MPFLYILTKSRQPEIDEVRLGKLLCPYQGNIQCTAFAHGWLYYSPICSIENNLCKIPKDMNKHSPCSSWLEISISQEKMVFQTDPLGTFPLWYYSDDHRVIITSEVKSLSELINIQFDRTVHTHKPLIHYSPYHNVQRVKPGARLEVSRDLHIEEQGKLPLEFYSENTHPVLIDHLRDAARVAASSEGQWGVFLSGGIDSSVISALLRQFIPTLETYTLGDEYWAAREVADFLQLPHHRISVDDVLAHFRHVVFCNEIFDGLTAETLAQLSILAKASASRSRHIATGYGADLLFGSMLQHEEYMQTVGVTDLQSLIERTYITREFTPFFAWAHGIRLHHIFWHPAVMNAAFRIPPSENHKDFKDKAVLRKAAIENGLLHYQYAGRKKNAMTDGTQFNQILSDAFKLEDKHAYQQKSEFCVNLLQQIFS